MREVLIFLFNLWQELSVQSLWLGCSCVCGGGGGLEQGTSLLLLVELAAALFCMFNNGFRSLKHRHE